MNWDPASKNRDRITKRRQRRLREELLDAGIDLPATDGLRRSLIEELDYARYPPVHEGVLHSYGAVLVDSSLDCLELDGTFSTSAVTDEAVLRRLADGRHSFVLRHAESVGLLLLLDSPHDREAELVRLRRRTNQPSTTIVQRRSNGNVRVVGPNGLFIWDGARWWTKPYAAPFARAVLDVVPNAPSDTLHSLLDFCVHTMSPADAGACLVWALDADDIADVDGLNPSRPPTPIPHLSFDQFAKRAAIRQLLTQVDGAAIVDRAGQLIAIEAHLRSSVQSHDNVRRDPSRGTRHAAARRYSFDHRARIVFVISRDGPVTVYFGGEEIAAIQTRTEDHDSGPDADA
ncbi:diadenylate cyclase [Ilumatobacter sp.]|uniref:diadenylate cyclase n=1 Tax=Ilumatobacter sp. TaxID=1967498 RepID=UPI0037517E02